MLNHEDVPKAEIIDGLRRMHEVVSNLEASEQYEVKDEHELFLAALIKHARLYES